MTDQRDSRRYRCAICADVVEDGEELRKHRDSHDETGIRFKHVTE